MRFYYNKELYAELLETIYDYEAANVEVDIGGYLGELDISDRLSDGDYSADNGSPAWSFSGKISGYLPSRLRNAPLRLFANFGGIIVPIFEGMISLPIPGDDYTTQIVAATPGALLDKVKLRQYVSYSQATPESVVRSALYRVPLYDRGNIRVTPFGTPLLDFLNDDGFEDSATPMDILTAVQDQIKYFYQDTPVDRGHRATKDVGTGEASEIIWQYDAENAREVYAWTDPSWATPDEQFSSVVVRDQFPVDDPRYKSAYRIWQEVPVFYPGLDFPPVGDQIEFIDFSGNDDVDPSTSVASALQRAIDEARTLGAGTWNFQMTVAYNPFYDPQDVISMRSTYEDDTGYYERNWRGVLDGIQQNILGDQIGTDLSGRAFLVREERLPDPPIRLYNVKPQVVDWQTIDRIFEETDEEILIHDSVDWVINEPETYLFTDDAPLTELTEELEFADDI